MYDRISQVNNVDIKVITLASLFQIGDSIKLSPKTYVLAEQYRVPDFKEENDSEFNEFPIFSKEIPQPVVTEKVQMKIINKSKVIKVNNVDILGLSSSAIFQIGSNIMMNPEARVKHIRHLHNQTDK